MNNDIKLKKNIYLFQPQYAVEFRNELNYWIPYSVGCIWSYCEQFADIKENYDLKDIIFKRELESDIQEKISDPTIVAFSCYQWNRNYNLKTAEYIKNLYPNCVILFGGPEVTVDFTLYNFIDSIIFAEGEYAMLDILRKIIANEPIPSVYKKQRVECDNLPSPYATGVFDNIIKNNPGVKWATTLETNRGCPFSCTFCDWGGLTYSKVKKFPMERVKQDLDWISKNPIAYIFCADANFGIFKERDLKIAELVKQTSIANPTLEIFNATYNKNNNEWSFKILERLEDLNKGFTVSVQSMNYETLRAIKRENLGINDLEKIFKMCQDYGVNAYTELILGLPNETRESFIEGLTQLLELGQHNQIEVWFTDLLVNSELATGPSKILYGIKTVKTKNYLALLNQDDHNEIDEEIEIVSSTKTMPIEDMISCYMYAWMIVNVHLQGYTQLTSKYCRYKYHVSYRKFYDKLLSLIENDLTLGKIYNEVLNIVSTLLKFGTLPSGVSAHNLIFLKGFDLYKHKKLLMQLGWQILDQFSEEDLKSIKKIQESFIYDESTNYPIEISCDFDFDNCVFRKTEYSISPKAKLNLENFYDLYYALRRKGFIKNKIGRI